MNNQNSPKVYYSNCDLFFCVECSGLLEYQIPRPCECKDQSRSCSLYPLTPLVHTPRLTPTVNSFPSTPETDGAGKISTKIRALITQIKSHTNEKHIVFSSWTSNLDMVERGLRDDADSNLQCVRIDGKVAAKKRGQILWQFHNDPNISVILVTISCGAWGLDLTAASRVHLLEPQWNPSLEDQALARVHRLGQTPPVTAIRYVMEDSFEEHILKVQDRKKLLATALLSNESSLQSLRNLLIGEA